MRAITYTRPGDPSVLELVEKPIPEPGAGEARIRVLVSGVNPTDWKSRSGAFGGALTQATVPNHDGAGMVDAVGAGVTGLGVGDRVWVTLAGDGGPAGGTAQEPRLRHGVEPEGKSGVTGTFLIIRTSLALLLGTVPQVKPRWERERRHADTGIEVWASALGAHSPVTAGLRVD